jgi:hypothetical protein
MDSFTEKEILVWSFYLRVTEDFITPSGLQDGHDQAPEPNSQETRATPCISSSFRSREIREAVTNTILYTIHFFFERK